ncbi:MAG: DNA-3-methyladenine glycosylase 2 family protein [Bryobacterales bacterium]|nr:DNA-3-methyladenine glycosylase 2 family protein [Bryobacterales bacterium]
MRKAISHLKNADPVMARIIHSVGPYKIVYREPDFTTLARSIVYQQVSGAAAATMLARLTAAAGRGGRLIPNRILELGEEGLRPCGISRQKAGYLMNLSEKTRSRAIHFARLPGLTDTEIIAELTQVKGIGVWTAQMFLMFALRRHDILPTGDLGVRNAMWKAYELPAPPTPAQMERIAEPWRPYASVASWYLWRSLDGMAEI